MEIFDDENKNRDYILEKLKNYDKSETYNCLIEKEIPVPYRQIYIPDRNSMEIWCFKQDICIYRKLFDKNIDKNNVVISSGDKSLLKIDFENIKKKEDVGMPFVIIETKMAKTNTHELLASSEKIRMIKSIFPYCKCILLVFGDLQPPRIYRICSQFDEIIFLSKLDDHYIIPVISKIINEIGKAYYNVTLVASF